MKIVCVCTGNTCRSPMAAALAAPESLRFTIWAYDNGTGETYFTADVTL